MTHFVHQQPLSRYEDLLLLHFADSMVDLWLCAVSIYNADYNFTDAFLHPGPGM